MTALLSRAIAGHFVSFDRETSLRMSRVRHRDTAPELIVRSMLARLGLRYRVRNKDLPGSPDIANRAARWAVFVHGCYWHRHAGCSRATTPERNAEFWRTKFDSNVARDRRAVAALRDSGFTVITIWECETRNRKVVGRALRPVVEPARRR